MTQRRALLLFPSVHDVIAAEQALLDAKLYCDLVPVPRELSSECGMAVEVHQDDLEQVKAALGTITDRCEGIHELAR